MAEIIKDGFVFYDRYKKDDIFSFSTDSEEDIKNSINYIKKHKLKYVSLNWKLQEKLENFDFLKDLDFIEEIYISKYDKNYDGIYYLKNLKALSVLYNGEKVKPDIDFSRFEKLESLSLNWYNREIDVSGNKNLKHLVIWKFKPKTKSFSYIKLPESVESFEITESNIENFNGLKLPNLKSFEANYCSKLSTLEGLKNCSEKLESFILGVCRNLHDYEELKYGENLKKIILSECGDMESLSWLKSLKNVKHFTFLNTKVIDGDVSLCAKIDYVAFTNSKHYNHKMEEFNDKY